MTVTAMLINIETGEKTKYYDTNLKDILKSVRGIFFKAKQPLYDGREHVGRLYNLDVYFLNKSFKVSDILKGKIKEEKMKKLKIESSTIANIYYEIAEQLLIVEFKRGATYHYYKVHYEDVLGLIFADSSGSYFNNFIAKHYTYEKVGG